MWFVSKTILQNIWFLPIASALEFCKADLLELQGGVETNEDGYLADKLGIDFVVLQFFGVEGERWNVKNTFKSSQSWTKYLWMWSKSNKYLWFGSKLKKILSSMVEVDFALLHPWCWRWYICWSRIIAESSSQQIFFTSTQGSDILYHILGKKEKNFSHNIGVECMEDTWQGFEMFWEHINLKIEIFFMLLVLSSREVECNV